MGARARRHARACSAASRTSLARLLDRRVDPTAPEGERIEGVSDLREPPEAPPLPDFAALLAGASLLPDQPTRSPGRRRRLLAGVAAAAVLAAGGTAWALAGHDDQPARTTAVAASVPVQRVVAVALSDDDRLTGVAVLAGTPQGDAQQVMVPSRLLLDVPGAGRIAVAQALVPGPEAPGRAVADALGLRVDATWRCRGPTSSRWSTASAASRSTSTST
ncbi:hypothetical protein GCM10025868_09480 [Angustibacter aerolatus]|uniref:SAF domain-containing protein n=1 Tax=Angustibacter aerolatus TaxID=1162965 RepID=A0ABQ6JE48_9ACTN|nr:hypothetical protein [Angustibacter aerolatus]GMA85698.1 hypothetical protein GCM10025868_09480 [Angustibacter aerolatus]